jgi:hypothetical protein
MIITNPEKCLELSKQIYSYDRVLSTPAFKKLLNESFSPDSYLFFHEEDEILPLVAKGDICHFYGGDLPFNEFNRVPNSKKILSKCFEFCENHNLSLKLTSIVNDPVSLLSDSRLAYDVPYNQLWLRKNIKEFDIENFLLSFKSKKRDKLKKALALSHKFDILEVNSNNERLDFLNNTYESINNIFENRGLVSCWKNNKNLYRKVNEYFWDNFKTINRVFTNKTTNQMEASYTLVFNDNEIFLAFSNCYNFNIEYFQYFIYLDILKTSAFHAKNKDIELNAGRGNFSYKSRMGFTPVPMYALVNAPDWSPKNNNDISESERVTLYGRDFGYNLS